MRAGPGGTDGASAADHGEDRRRVGTRATSPTVPGAGRGAGKPWRKRSRVERLGGCRQPGRESRSLTPRFTRGADVHRHSDAAAELGAPAPALRADCACALGGDGGQATHEDGHPSGGADSGQAGWDVLAGGGGPRQAATCRRGAAEGRAEKVTCDNGLREPKSSVWPQAAAVSSERLAVGPRPRASVSWVSQ